MSAAANTAAVRAWIARTLAGVEELGRIHDRERRAARDADLRALYQPPGGGALAGAFVRRVARADTRIGGARLWRVATRWEIHAFRVFSDAGGDGAAASEPAFDAALDRAAAAFRRAIREAERAGPLTRARLPGRGAASGRAAAPAADPGDEAPDGLRLEHSGPEMFAGILCHRARLSLVTVHHEGEGAGR